MRPAHFSLLIIQSSKYPLLLVQGIEVLALPPSLEDTATSSTRTLELLLGIHEARLHPHAISLVVSNALTVQEIRQSRLDLLGDMHQLLLFLLNLVHDTLIQDGR